MFISVSSHKASLVGVAILNKQSLYLGGWGGDGVSQAWSAVVRSKSGHYNLHNLHPLGDFICVKMCFLCLALCYAESST